MKKLKPAEWKTADDIPQPLIPYYCAGYNAAVDGYERPKWKHSQRLIAANLGYDAGLREFGLSEAKDGEDGR